MAIEIDIEIEIEIAYTHARNTKMRGTLARRERVWYIANREPSNIPRDRNLHLVLNQSHPLLRGTLFYVNAQSK